MDHDQEAGLEEAASSRAERLSAQWHQAKLAVVGVQESRRPSGRYETSHYIVLASGAQQCQNIPHHGCELWLHKSLPILTDPSNALTWSQFRLAVAHSDPRRLVVHLRHEALEFSFVVLHAPCRSASSTLETVAAWWDDTTALMHKISLARMTWFCVDANAPLASAESEYYGLAGQEHMNEQGYLFEQFLQASCIYAPTTMSWCHSGDHHTWTHPRGSRLRRDYVPCTADAFHWCQASWTDSSIDFGFAHDDHLPVCMSLQGWWCGYEMFAGIAWPS